VQRLAEGPFKGDKAKAEMMVSSLYVSHDFPSFSLISPIPFGIVLFPCRPIIPVGECHENSKRVRDS
jgi:hypothetical protein